MGEYSEELRDEPSASLEIDLDYEFDAPQFYDFSQEETALEILEVDSWFKTLIDYPPSPYAVKLNWKLNLESAKLQGKDDNVRGEDSDNHTNQELLKTNIRSPQKPSMPTSSFMKPTASQLAKQNRLQEVSCNRLSRRSPNTAVKIQGKSPWNSSLTEGQATKRQKLEAGYINKAMKHQALFLHKSRNLGIARPKGTIPRETVLETAARAQRQRSKITSEMGRCEQLKTCSFKARPLNRKIFKAPSSPLSKTTPQQPKFQVFHLRTAERAKHHATFDDAKTCIRSSTSQSQTTEKKRINPIAALKEKKMENFHNLKARSNDKKEFKLPNVKKVAQEPLIELFSKLSLSSEAGSDEKTKSKLNLHKKGAKENEPRTLHLEREMMNMIKSKPCMFGLNQSLCGGEQMIHEIGPRMNINRSLGIH